MQGLVNVKILTEEGVVHGNIGFKNGKIDTITEEMIQNGWSFDEDVIVVPGFIDEHVHGVNNRDAMDGTKESLCIIAQSLPKEGTTSFLATTMTQSVEKINKALTNIHQYMKIEDQQGAEVLGVHLEGPFLNVEACGAQAPEHIVHPNVEQFKMYQALSGYTIKYVTVAPEVDGGLELIKYLKQHNIVASLGHTKATYEETLQAIHAGATSVTHCYNAMTGLHHREIGVLGAVLLHDELHAELIADGIHVNKKAIEVLYKVKGKDNITLITDSMRAKGLEDGTYDLGGQDVTVKGEEARLENGALAGSVLKMNHAVKNMMEFLDISLEEAVVMASTNPAKKLGVFDRKGSIALGKDADLVVLNKDYDIVMTLCRGEIAYIKE